MNQEKCSSKTQNQILKEVQHNSTTTLQNIKTENPNFHWGSSFYKTTGDTALHIAAQLGYLSLIDYLLTEFQPCTVDIKNKDDKTPLHEAAQFAQVESVEKLCSYGADVNALRRGDWTALMLACTKLKPDVSLCIVKILVEKGANVNVANKDGWTCVHILAREGGCEIFDFLLEHGVKVDVQTKNGRTALHIAALHGQKEFASRLLQYIDINARDSCGSTPLLEAIMGRNITLAKFLVEQGADIHASNNADLSLVHLAASVGHIDVIDFVLNHLKLDINSQNKNGWTPAHCAARKGLEDVYEYLKKLGADVSVKDRFNRTASDYFMG